VKTTMFSEATYRRWQGLQGWRTGRRTVFRMMPENFKVASCHYTANTATEDSS